MSKEDEFRERNKGRVEEIHQACHKNSRAHIITTLKNDFGIEKEEAVDYINNFCSKKIVDKKAVYMVRSIREENVVQGNEEESLIGLPTSKKRESE